MTIAVVETSLFVRSQITVVYWETIIYFYFSHLPINFTFNNLCSCTLFKSQMCIIILFSVNQTRSKHTKNMKLILLIFGLIATAMTADDSKALERLSNSNKLLTAKLLTEVSKQNRKSPLVLSAFSLLTPLGLLSLAAVKKSRDELLKVLDLPDDNNTVQVFSLINSKLKSVKGVELKVANKLYVANRYDLKPEFSSLSRRVFGSEVEKTDFELNVKASKKINNWVQNNTNGLVKDLVSPDSLSIGTSAVLVNTIYFKGSWKEKFDKKKTLNLYFHINKYFSLPIPFMTKTSVLPYGASKELDAVLLKLPFQGDETSLLVVLPNKKFGLAALKNKLKNPALLENAVKDMNNVTVSVFLPKFKIQTETNLKQALKNLGVKQVFDLSSRLDNLLVNHDDVLYVSEAKQKAVIEIDEEGAEAAGGNKMDLFGRSTLVESYPKYYFLANSPFYYELRHGNEALFSGVYTIEVERNV